MSKCSQALNWRQLKDYSSPAHLVLWVAHCALIWRAGDGKFIKGRRILAGASNCRWTDGLAGPKRFKDAMPSFTWQLELMSMIVKVSMIGRLSWLIRNGH